MPASSGVWRALGCPEKIHRTSARALAAAARVPDALPAVLGGFSKLGRAHDKSCPKCHSLFGNHDASFFFFLIPKTVAIIRQMFRAGGVNTHI